jgi:RNA polymerase sigma-70 factor (ECF subfamily)
VDDRDDFELLRQWSAGDRTAGDALVVRHFGAVFRFLRNKIDNDDLLDDLAQRSFLGALEGAGRFARRSTFRTYLLAIARYQLVEHLREGARRRSVAVDDVSVYRIAAPGPGPGTLLALGAERTLLLHALRRLPVDMQITLELHYWERMPLAEIAVVTAVPEGTVKSRLFRARELLREIIASMEADEHVRQQTASNLDDWAAALRDAIDRPAPAQRG